MHKLSEEAFEKDIMDISERELWFLFYTLLLYEC